MDSVAEETVLADKVQIAELKAMDRRRIRVNLTKNTKGYSYETTVEYEWYGEGEQDVKAGRDVLETLLCESDNLARAEIRQREESDRRASEQAAAD